MTVALTDPERHQACGFVAIFISAMERGEATAGPLIMQARCLNQDRGHRPVQTAPGDGSHTNSPRLSYGLEPTSPHARKFQIFVPYHTFASSRTTEKDSFTNIWLSTRMPPHSRHTYRTQTENADISSHPTRGEPSQGNDARLRWAKLADARSVAAGSATDREPAACPVSGARPRE